MDAEKQTQHHPALFQLVTTINTSPVVLDVGEQSRKCVSEPGNVNGFRKSSRLRNQI